MIEVRIHGRGGQGNVIAAYLLAAAAIKAGFYAQAFPAFGAERRGAPVAAFVRLKKSEIRRRCEIETPQFVIVQDPTLLHMAGTLAGLTAGGGILVNSGRGERSRDSFADGQRIVCLPATDIAERAIGKPIPNVPLLSALIALTGVFPPEALRDALSDRFDGETAKRNWAAADAASSVVKAGEWRDVIDAYAD